MTEIHDLAQQNIQHKYTIPDFLKQPYHSSDPFQLSHSLMNDLHECERKFELNRILYNPVPIAKEERAYFIRGTAYGAGVQAYLLTGDMNLALVVAWLSYYPEVEDLYRLPTISQARTLNNLLLSKDKLDIIRRDYEVAFFDGRPAIELSIRVNITGRWYYTGHIDVVLINKQTRKYVVFEVKTTLARITDLRPLYQNSGQGIGYSIVLDKIVGEKQNEYEVLYLVCRDKNNSDFIPDIEVYPFHKNIVDRLKWFYTLGMDVERLDKMLELGLFPMRGHSCMQFGKVCSHFGFCQITAGDSKRKEDVNTYQYSFTFEMQDIINDHIRRITK